MLRKPSFLNTSVQREKWWWPRTWPYLICINVTMFKRMWNPDLRTRQFGYRNTAVWCIPVSDTSTLISSQSLTLCISFIDIHTCLSCTRLYRLTGLIDLYSAFLKKKKIDRSNRYICKCVLCCSIMHAWKGKSSKQG